MIQNETRELHADLQRLLWTIRAIAESDKRAPSAFAAAYRGRR